MTKLETPMIERFWSIVGGRMCEEYPVVFKDGGRQRRSVDAVIVLSEPTVRVGWREVGDLRGKDIMIVQAKASRLSLPLLGQAVFSPVLAADLGAKTMTPVCICSESDPEIAAIAQERGVQLVIDAEDGTRAPFRLQPKVRDIERVAAKFDGDLHLKVPLTDSQSGPQAHGLIAPSGTALIGHEASNGLPPTSLTIISSSGSAGFGMWVLGQAVFGADLVERRFGVRPERNIVVVPRDDEAIRAIAVAERVEAVITEGG